MAKITLVWNGKISKNSSETECALDYSQGVASGYVKFPSWFEK